jgi:hypothetical protein
MQFCRVVTKNEKYQEAHKNIIKALVCKCLGLIIVFNAINALIIH